MKLKGLIRTLEKQHRELKQIAALRRIDKADRGQFSDELSLTDFEKRLIAGTLKRADGNLSEAARILQVGRDQLRYKVANYRLNRHTAKVPGSRT